MPAKRGEGGRIYRKEGKVLAEIWTVNGNKSLQLPAI